MNIEDSDELTLIFNYRKDKTMVLINEVELATTLAHNAMLNDILTNRDEDISDEDIYLDIDNGTEYTEYAQRIFDEHYDYFYEIISKIAVKEEE